MTLSKADFQKACLTYGLNWWGTAADGKTVSQRLDELAAWIERQVSCECCGEHEARECPKCEEIFDFVSGDKTIAEAQDPP